MTDEIIEKLRTLQQKQTLEESRIQHLFVLARKLIEKQPQNNKVHYALLKFYCDWTLHPGIEHSEEGALLLSRMHDTILIHFKKTNNSSFAKDLTTTLSLENVRNQLNELIFKSGGSPDMFTRQNWEEIIPILAEIISHCPLKIDIKYPKLLKIKQLIKSQPIKGTSVVEELAITKILNKHQFLDSRKSETEVIFCFRIKTTDTTEIITPLTE